MKKKLYFIFFLLFLISISIISQNCNSYFKKCTSVPEGFEESSSSRSFKIRRGKNVQFVLTAYGGREYFFSICAKTKVGDLQFRLIDPESETVLYDNSSEVLCESKIIKVEFTQKIIIQVFAPNWKSNNLYECGGFRIAYKK